jgi:hypothetical protein
LRQEKVLCQLLCDRRTALGDAPVQKIGKRGTKNAEGIDAVMFVKTPVLDSDESLRNVFGHFLQGQRRAGKVATPRKRPILEIDDFDRGRLFGNLKRLNGWQMRTHVDQRSYAADEDPQRRDATPVDRAADQRTSTPRLVFIAFAGPVAGLGAHFG